MAPTEILAQQIYDNLKTFLISSNIIPTLLTGSTRNKPEIYDKIEKKELNFIIGTHAIFQEKLLFNNLSYVIIDEQHRFGVQQRLSLAEKGVHANILLMSATPIPRTLALAQYGEIEQIIVNERPAFQKQIITKVTNKDKIKELILFLKKNINPQQQAYWICPLVEASDNQQYKDVETRYKSLKKTFGKEVQFLHGKMKSEEKEKIIQDFKKGVTKLLVATTVIEVGIDNKNANFIIIENAEKFGLSQLHQLRGRVGRGSIQGYCFVLYGEEITINSTERLKIFKNTHDGFQLAEKDLVIRGTGDILGYRQSGDSLFKFVNVQDDQEIIIDALEYVKKIISKKIYEDAKFKKNIYKLLVFFKQQEAIKLLFS
jgi:ATP-dependent DNA helicase RecG